MAMQSRLIKNVAFDNGNEVRVPIPRQHFAHRFNLKAILGTLTGGAGGNFVAGAANKMVRNLRLEIGGQLTKDNIRFEDLRRLNVLVYKDNFPTDGYAYLDLSRLPTHGFTSLDLIVQFETAANLNDGDHTDMSGASLQVRALLELNEGQTIQNSPLTLRKTQVVDAGGKTEVKADLRSGNVLQAVLVVPLDASGDELDSLITSVTVEQDGVKHHIAAEAWADLQEENKADFELDALPSGWAIVNFDKFGDGSQALRTGSMNTLEFIFQTDNVAGATIRLVPLEVALPR